MATEKAENLIAVQRFLDSIEVHYHTIINERGWRIEVEDEVSGKGLDDLIKVVDTQAHVIARTIPNVGLFLQTERFSQSDSIGEAKEVVEA